MYYLKDILEKLSYQKFVGNLDTVVSTTKPLDADNKDIEAIMWVNEKNVSAAAQLKAGTLICPDNFSESLQPGVNYIYSVHPRSVFREVLYNFFVEKVTPEVSPSSIIHESVVLGLNNYIGHNVVLEKNCTIGNDCHIDHNTVIKAGSVIGNKVKIGSNCTIGGIGFGYEKDINGEYILIPHIGNVILEDNVEIGNNTCIDRAVIGSTLLKSNVKIDNLVHIAHGVKIGKNSLVIANAMVAGSCIIGENVWVAPSSSILNKKNLADNVIVGMGAVVLKDVPENDVVVGNPAKSLNFKASQ